MSGCAPLQMSRRARPEEDCSCKLPCMLTYWRSVPAFGCVTSQHINVYTCSLPAPYEPKASADQTVQCFMLWISSIDVADLNVSSMQASRQPGTCCGSEPSKEMAD